MSQERSRLEEYAEALGVPTEDLPGSDLVFPTPKELPMPEPITVTDQTPPVPRKGHHVDHWLEEHTASDILGKEANRHLHADHVAWCQANGVFPMTMTALSRALHERGFVRFKYAATRGFRGLRLLHPRGGWDR